MQKLQLIIGLTVIIVFGSCSRRTVDQNPKHNSSQTSSSKTSTSKIKDNKKPFDSLETYVNAELFKMEFIKGENLSDILDLAASQNKLVYLDVNASWCTPCKLMQRDVYTNQEVGNFFNNNFINYMVDIDKKEGPDLKIIFDIKSVPTLLWLDAKGRVVHRYEGAQYHRDLLASAQKALDTRK